MPNFRELVELNRNGDLGKLLAEKFHGEIGKLQPRKDADFIIGFKSETLTPSTEGIKATITKHYEKLGFVVENPEIAGGMFECIIHDGNRETGFVKLVVTTRYPLQIGGHHHYARITTEVYE